MQWISMKDRLPEKNALCLCCVRYWMSYRRDKPFVIEALIYKGLPIWQYLEGDEVVLNVTYWMYLPEPPTEGEKHD